VADALRRDLREVLFRRNLRVRNGAIRTVVGFPQRNFAARLLSEQPSLSCRSGLVLRMPAYSVKAEGPYAAETVRAEPRPAMCRSG